METINCKHVEPNGKVCRRVAFRNLFYCYAHKHLYLGGETRTEYEKRRKTLSEEGKTLPEEDPDYEPPIMKAMLEDPEPLPDPEPEQEPRPLSPDWDELQEEEGWWDSALVEATPEERKKEALANAEVAERSLKAEEIYTVASLGGEVTDEMFGRDLSSSIVMGGITGFAALIAIPFLPVILMMLVAGAVGGNVGSGGGDFANDTISSLSQALWKLQFFAVFISGGALLGFSNHRKRMEALTKGKADFIAEGSLMDS
ncbi:MAG: hypothetical protein QF354_03860 [Candidatus Thalassarchaeum sp.]|nr:hypothetical protein [Candidatus Thalassarchaeum sp.]